MFQTHELIGRMANLIGYGKVAKYSSVTLQTANAWGRPVSTNDDPTASGKRNPLDAVCTLIALAHKEGDRELARDIADHFPAYCDYLDAKAGIGERESAREIGRKLVLVRKAGR